MRNIKNEKFTFTASMSHNIHVYHIFSIFSKNSLKLKNYLNNNGVGTGFHYPVPVHLQKPYCYLGYKKGSLPVTEKISKNQLSIPIFPEMKEEEINYVIDLLNKF